MPKVSMKMAKEGDVLLRDVMIENVVLFEAGTVLVKKSIEILQVLGVEAVYVESRDIKRFNTLKDVFNNIDVRFSYVEDNPYMMSLKRLIKDTLANMRPNIEEHGH